MVDTLPLEEAVYVQAKVVEDSLTALQAGKAQWDEELARVTADLKAKHEPIVKGLQEAYEAASSKLAELMGKMTQWLEEVKTKPITSYTISDTKLTLVRASIKFAPDVVDANKVDGNILNVCTTLRLLKHSLALSVWEMLSE